VGSAEIQAKATIAAGLIVRGAVEVPTLPIRDELVRDAATLRLRELTDYLYLIITMGPPDPT
jgi:hypothetical protein